MTDSSVRQLMGNLSRRAGLDRPIRPHMLRHATATELAEAGVAIDVVQEILGHRSIESTRVYVHLSQRRLRDAMEGLEERSGSQARRMEIDIR